jgi:hypothetical protein
MNQFKILIILIENVALEQVNPCGLCIDLKSDVAILQYVQSFMSDINTLNSIPHIVGDFGRSFKLSGRDEALVDAAKCFQNMTKSFASREDRRIPVCSGLSGLGKTRLLEEWEAIFDIAGISENRIGLLIAYYNGSMPQPIERYMTIEASFSWRLLHRLFIDGNGPNFSTWFRNHLPANAKDLTLEQALDVVRYKFVSSGRLKGNDTLNLFLGIDEYQNIENVRGVPVVSKQGLLQDLLDVFGNILARSSKGIRIFPMFAGTDLSVLSIANSSKTETIRMPMHFLSTIQVENAISSVPLGLHLLGLAPVRRHLFYFGGVARWTFQYAEQLLNILKDSKEKIIPVKTIEEVFTRIRDLYVMSWKRSISKEHSLGPIDFIFLAAQSLSGSSIQVDDYLNGKVSWSRLEDSSACLIYGNPGKSFFVSVPYALYYLITDYNPNSFQNHAIQYFLLTLMSLFDNVDMMVYHRAPWQLWEAFGAHFHALRINSLIIIGKAEIKLKELFSGALVAGCDEKVILQPMQIMETEDVYCSDIGPEIGTKGYYDLKQNWIKGGWVVINGENGTGVDIFFSLEVTDKRRRIIVTDQRKRASQPLGSNRITNLIERARIIPQNLGFRSISVVSCVFSCFTSSSFGIQDIPNNSCVVSYNQAKDYHGSLWIHPAASPCVDINRAPISYLNMLFLGRDSEKLCKSILEEQRNKRKFLQIRELESFVKKSNMDAYLREDSQERIVFS